MSERYTDDANGAELTEGDRIAKHLVARTPGQLGHSRSADPDAPDTQLVALSVTDRYDDHHTALLADPDDGTLVRATRLSSNQAWIQREADWSVKETGERVIVEEAEIAQWPDDSDDPDDVTDEVQRWVDVVIDGRKDGSDDPADELDLSGTSLTIYDPYGPHKAHAEITLETDGTVEPLDNDA